MRRVGLALLLVTWWVFMLATASQAIQTPPRPVGPLPTLQHRTPPPGVLPVDVGDEPLGSERT